MAPRKGVTNNPKGRTVGTKNQRTIEWEIIKDKMLTTHTARANRVLDSMDDKEFMDAFMKLLEYFKPKLQRSEVTNTDNSTIEINVNWDENTKFIHSASKASLQSGESTQQG